MLSAITLVVLVVFNRIVCFIALVNLYIHCVLQIPQSSIFKPNFLFNQMWNTTFTTFVGSAFKCDSCICFSSQSCSYGQIINQNIGANTCQQNYVGERYVCGYIYPWGFVLCQWKPPPATPEIICWEDFLPRALPKRLPSADKSSFLIIFVLSSICIRVSPLCQQNHT